jgi:GxxExxY protein
VVQLEEEGLTWKVRGCVYDVYRELGHGFLERVYQRALLMELERRGVGAHSNVHIPVEYKGQLVGNFVADIVVEERVVVELKAQRRMPLGTEAQLINYLKASGMRVGLLINFAFPKATVTRIVA